MNRQKLIILVIAAAIVVAAAVGISLLARDNTPTYGPVRIWVAEATAGFTKARIERFKADNPQYAGLQVVIEPVGEGDAANNMLTDIEAGADIFGFAQDQLARLVAAGALEVVPEEIVSSVRAENDSSSVAAVTLGDTVYAYPMTSDNGYFLYYDKSVVSDPTSLEAILADCEKAGRNFYFELNSGWYQPAFFFGAGATLTYGVDNTGKISSVDCSYASENGLRALKAMIKVAQSPAHVNGSSASNATNIGAIVDGTWDAVTLQSILGENYAAAKLPTVDGFQLGGFSGFKMLGVKPQTNAEKLDACDALAAYLSSGEVQLARYNAVKWGPSNLKAQQAEAVKADTALSALSDQLKHCIRQGQYPNEYWTLAAALGDDILADKLDNATDQELMEVLTAFQTAAASYVTR